MAYIDNYQAAQFPTFVQRVEASMIQACINIAAEVNTTPNHANRVVFAKMAAQNPGTWAPIMAYGVAVNLAATQANISTFTDAQIDTSMSSIFNAYAGAS